MALIELKDVSKLYGFGDATTVALDEVSLAVNKNEFVAIMGPSGCGKTTLMNIIGLLDRPTNGSYYIDNRSAARFSSVKRARLRRDRIGFVFQSFNFLPRLTVLENVALPLVYKGIGTTRSLKRASHILEQLGLKDREYFLPSQLSGGQVQRAAIARALITEPSIIIADEPTGNLDSSSSLVIMELLGEIHKNGSTILLVTHNPQLTRYANRVVYMQDGSIVHDQRTQIGVVPRRARRIIFTFPTKSEDDDLAGVSELMRTLPGGDTSKPAAKRRKKARKKTKSYRSKK